MNHFRRNSHVPSSPEFQLHLVYSFKDSSLEQLFPCNHFVFVFPREVTMTSFSTETNVEQFCLFDMLQITFVVDF